MMSWFKIESIDNTTFAISEYGHWEKMHSYLLIGEEYSLLIDTGLGIGNIKDEVCSLTNLPIKVVNTHAHWDHIGGNNLFNDISVHKDDLSWIKNGLPIPIAAIKEELIKEKFIQEAPEYFNINNYRINTTYNAVVLENDEIIDIGNRKIKVLHTPGHSPGHICLFEEERGYLYSGDLIYLGTLYAFYPSTDPVKFKESIAKINEIPKINKILPSHNELKVPVNIINKISNAFKSIENKKMLRQGTGIFDFGDFKIHL